MPDDKPRTPAERLHERASDLARDALDLQALAALSTDREQMHQIAAWCDQHPDGHGAFFEVQYGVGGEKAWEVNLFLGTEYHHPSTITGNILKASSPELETALVEMLKLLRDVTPAPQ